MTALQALGDSFSCGQGVGVRVPLERTWAGLLAGYLGLDHRSLAVPGARTCDVVRDQLPAALPAQVSTLLVGLNDVARPGFRDGTTARHLLRVVEALSAMSAVVVVARLHDPSVVMRLPTVLRQPLRRRLEVVNEAVDAATRLPRVRLLDLGALQALRLPGCWAVDRVHPSAAGHEVIAQAAAELMGHTLSLPEVGPGATRAERVRWKVRHGAPYLVGQASLPR